MNQVINYTDFALESSVESLKMMNKYRLIHLAAEADFMLECMDCGILSPILEADASTSIFARVKESIAKFFNKVIGLFKERSKAKADKYVPWIKDNMKSIKKRSENLTLELTPYWKSNWNEDIKTMTNVVNKIFDNIKNGRFTDYKFAKELVTLGDDVSSTENLKSKLITRFSIGELDKTSMEQVKVEKFGQTNTIEDMFKYIFEYASDVGAALTQLEKEITRKLDQVSPKTLTIKESSFIDIEECLLCESDLVTLINYTEVVTEAGEENKGTTNTDGEKTSDTSVKINPDKEEGKGINDGDSNTDNKDGESNDARSKYISQCESFMKSMTTAFLTANEKRFVVYVNTMVAIGGSDGSPTTDDDGNVTSTSKDGDNDSDGDTQPKDEPKGKSKDKPKNKRKFISRKPKQK